MGSFSLQKPSIPRVIKPEVQVTWDNSSVGGLKITVHGDNVKVHCEKPQLYEHMANDDDNFDVFLSRKQVREFAQGLLDMLDGLEEVEAMIEERVKSRMHNIAATLKPETGE